MPEGIVHVIDGDEITREQIALVMRANGLSARCYESAKQFLENLPAERIGCVVADLHPSGIGALDLIRALHEQGRELPVVATLANATIRAAVSAMQAGAVDVLERPLKREELIAAVDLALRRGREQMPELGEVSEIVARLETLSARERQVLDLLVAGRPNKIIAYDLGISIRTIELYRSHVMTKMKASSLSELVRMAIAAGATPPARKAAG